MQKHDLYYVFWVVAHVFSEHCTKFGNSMELMLLSLLRNSSVISLIQIL